MSHFDDCIVLAEQRGWTLAYREGDTFKITKGDLVTGATNERLAEEFYGVDGFVRELDRIEAVGSYR
jgi:hypothetical protein